MDRYTGSPVGSLVPVEMPVGERMVRHQAFVPSPLPEEMSLSQAAWSAAVSAAVELGRLAGMTRSLPVEPSLFAGLTLRREALSTSALEGTYAPVADVLASEAAPLSPRTAAVTEVLNFAQAADHGVHRLRTLPVCMRLARELHAILVAGTPSEDWQKGRIRETQVVVGGGLVLDPAERLLNARYVPPPPGDGLINGLSQWERWLHTAALHQGMPVLIGRAGNGVGALVAHGGVASAGEDRCFTLPIRGVASLHRRQRSHRPVARRAPTRRSRCPGHADSSKPVSWTCRW